MMSSSQDFRIKMYIDYDRVGQVFFQNFFFEEFSIVIKIPLTKTIDGSNLRIEDFDLTKYIYLLYIDDCL